MTENGFDKRLRDVETKMATRVDCAMHTAETNRRLHDVEQWAATHDGRINAKWEAHEKWVPDIEQRLANLSKSQVSMRLSSAKLTGAMAAMSVLTGLAVKLLNLLG